MRQISSSAALWKQIPEYPDVLAWFDKKIAERFIGRVYARSRCAG